MAETPELVLRSTRVVTPQGVRPAAVAVAGGRIAEVLPYDAYADDRVRDYGDAALLPGLVDTHVHVNDPGRAAWEGFATATSAAAAGGVTTVLDMPLNSIPPTTTPAHLAVKRATAETGAYTDVGFWGGAIPGNAGELRPLHRAGVFGFKCFLSPSGVEEFPELAPDELAEAMAGIAGFGGLLLVHAEDPGHLAAAPPPDGSRRYADFLASRPPAAELDAIARLVALARRLDARVHVLHLSSAEALPLIAAARASGVRMTAETCPHFLTLTAEEVPDGATEFKCCPPIREAANQDALWAGLADGTIDCVVSDHSPCTPELKVPDFGAAWGGIASLQLGLPVVWTAAAARGFGLADVARWMATAPARLAGLDGRKGAIAPGHDADIAVLDPDATFTVDPAALHHRNPVTAYAGRTLRGVVRATWLRGRLIAGNGRVTGPCGRLIRRQDRGGAAAELAGAAASDGLSRTTAPAEAGAAGAADAAGDCRVHEATRTIGAPAAATAPVIPRFTGAASPYRGGDPYADYRAPEPDTLPFGHLPDLASRRLGASVTAASDEFFAERENLTAPGPARFNPAAYGHKGKAMDGWETRRRRGATADVPHPAPDDHDWAIVRLGAPGVVRGLIVDTAHFRGNHPNEVSVEGAAFDGDGAPDAAVWTELLPRTPVGGHAANAFTVAVPAAAERRLTHLRLCQYPDGGVARLRAHGEVVPDPAWLAALGTFDLAALEHGGVAEDASDRFFSPPANSIMPGRSRSMEEGWETRRRRDGGHDWVRYRLAGRAVIRAVEIDTGCYKGNAPGWAALSVADDPGADPGGGEWHEVLPRTRLWPDAVHRFVLADVLGRDAPAATHARLDVFPDGGVARLRLHGSLTEDGARHLAERHRVLSTAR